VNRITQQEAFGVIVEIVREALAPGRMWRPDPEQVASRIARVVWGPGAARRVAQVEQLALVPAAPGPDRGPSLADRLHRHRVETFDRLRREGWPRGRARSQRKMAAKIPLSPRQLRRWLKNPPEVKKSGASG
jgi:hypothetical protein